MITADKPFLAIIARITKATKRSDLFDGKNDDKTYKELAKLAHPDSVPPNIKTLATTAFQHLNSLYHGDTKAAAPVVFGKWVVDQLLYSGEIADIYDVIAPEPAYLKLCRHPADNDLMENEIKALTAILGKNDPAEEKYTRLFPHILDTLLASKRRGIILDRRPLTMPLSEFKSKIDFIHLVWISNRLLNAIGFAHSQGLVHGAILPPHVIIGPVSRDLQLIDWCYSSMIGKLVAMDENYRDFYPPEAGSAKKTTLVPGFDLYMWAKIVRSLALSIPKRFEGILTWCEDPVSYHRPQSAWKVHTLWNEAAKEVYGKPTYLKLEV